MGTCCFTPKKTHFLWWYWLALASIVGIPMLLAARYVARRRAAGETDVERIGRRAGKIFWFSAIFFFVLVMIFGPGLAARLGVPSGYHYSYGIKYDTTLFTLTLEFLFCYVIANIAARMRKTSHLILRIAAVMVFFVIWMLLSKISFIEEVFYPLTAALMFAICLAMAWRWRDFLDRPLPATARRALLGFVVGAFLFYAAARYGNLAHFYIHEAARGNLPTVEAARPYMMR